MEGSGEWVNWRECDNTDTCLHLHKASKVWICSIEQLQYTDDTGGTNFTWALEKLPRLLYFTSCVETDLLVEGQNNEEKATEWSEWDGKDYLQYRAGGTGEDVAIHSQDSWAPCHQVEWQRHCHDTHMTPGGGETVLVSQKWREKE